MKLSKIIFKIKLKWPSDEYVITYKYTLNIKYIINKKVKITYITLGKILKKSYKDNNQHWGELPMQHEKKWTSKHKILEKKKDNYVLIKEFIHI